MRMQPYEIYPDRIIAHLDIDEHLRQISFTPEEIQDWTRELFSRNGTSFGHRVAYFHIPFCDKFCKFCSFYRVKKDASQLERFLDALIENLHTVSNYPYFTSVPFDAIYLGGGTPTTLTIAQMNRLTNAIRECLPLSSAVEFTCEARFAHITEELLQALQEGGVNRMSLGVQTFSPRMRKLIGRVCTAEEVIERIGLACRHIDVVNLDLIYNFPTQTLEEWEADLRIAAATDADGICAHTLVPVEDSPLAKLIARGDMEPLGDTKKQYDFYTMAQSILPEQGYQQINFTHFTCRREERIRYLRLRLEEGDCFPFGAGAVGNFGDLILINYRDIEQYIDMLWSKKFPAEVAALLPEPIKFLRALSGQIQQMRVEKEHFKKNYHIDLDEKYDALLTAWQSKGLIENYPDHFTLTPLGLFWGYNICSDFFRQF